MSMHRSTILLLICALMGSVVMSVAWWFRAPELFRGSFVALGYFSCALAVEIAFATKRTREMISIINFLLAMFILIYMIGYNHDYYLQHYLSFEPFLGVKIIAIYMPFICPPRRWIGVSSLALLAIMTMVKYYSWEPQFQAELGVQEPFSTVAIAGLSAVLYCFRLRLAELAKVEMVRQARAKALGHFTSMLISSQHLINTPLQRIEILAHMIGEKSPEAKDAVGQMKPSFELIRKVTGVLSIVNRDFKWDGLELPANAEELALQFSRILKDFEKSDLSSLP